MKNGILFFSLSLIAATISCTVSASHQAPTKTQECKLKQQEEKLETLRLSALRFSPNSPKRKQIENKANLLKKLIVAKTKGKKGKGKH